MSNIGFFPSSNGIASRSFKTTVQNNKIAFWGLIERQRTMFDRLEVGDYILFPDKGGIKWAGRLTAKFEDLNPLVPDNTGQNMIGDFHAKNFEHDPSGRYANFILIMEPVNIPQVTDYREYVVTKTGKHWNDGYPHEAHRVLPTTQCWGLHALIEQANA